MTSDAAGIVISVDGLSRSFGAMKAVQNVSFQVARGEIFGLVGPDGAGKTTIMRMLAGILPPDCGEIRIGGTDVVTDPEAAKARISYMPQRFGLYEDLTVAENIGFYADLFGVPGKERRARGRDLIAAAGLEAFEQRLAGQLSGGMKQKLGLVCALIHTPQVLLLDEPTTGVDPVSRRDFWGILYGLRESGVTIVLSTAYMDEAERCSRLALVHTGAISYCDTPDRLKRIMPGALLAVISDNPRDVRAILTGASGVLGTLLMGDRVHVHVDDAAQRIPEMQSLLAEKGIRAEVGVVEPGIEDVFVALLNAGERS